MCNVKAVPHSEKAAENYQQLPSSPQLYGVQLHCCSLGSQLSSALFPAAAGSCFQWRSSDKPAVHSLPSTKQQAGKVRD